MSSEEDRQKIVDKNKISLLIPFALYIGVSTNFPSFNKFLFFHFFIYLKNHLY